MSAMMLTTPSIAIAPFGNELAHAMAAADIQGRLHVLDDLEAQTGLKLPMSTAVSVDGDVQFDSSTLDFERVPFEGAIRRLRNLTPMTKLAFDGLSKRYKMQAFTIAGISDVALIDKIHEALAKVVADGGTDRDFRRAVNALTDEAGVERLASFHVETVFRTNVQRAYSYGRMEQMRDPDVAKALPYWKFRTAGDGRVRPEHEALNGFVARQDDPVWRKLYPPLGFNCRCIVTAILAKRAPAGADEPGIDRVPDASRSLLSNGGF